MTYKEAADFVMPWGKFSGLALDKIAETDEGLRYLDWLRGERGGSTSLGPRQPLDEALAAYLSDPVIASEVKKVVR